ncbi:MAG: hypothetical protein V4591_03325 [Bdellovibrionota bacterium]
MVTKNNHFISEYLLKFWLIKPGKIRVFDYHKLIFEDRCTETLFAKQHIFSQKQEDFFNKHIERILQQELLTIPNKNYRVKKRKNARALLLFVHDLVGRYCAAHSKNSEFVDFFTSLSEHDLNQLAHKLNTQYYIGIVTISDDSKLFFPSNLLIPIFDPKLKLCHYGVPFTGNNCFFLLKKGFDRLYLESISQGHAIAKLSAGNYRTDLVVVHSHYLHNEEELKRNLLEYRESNQHIAEQIDLFRHLEQFEN